MDSPIEKPSRLRRHAEPLMRFKRVGAADDVRGRRLNVATEVSSGLHRLELKLIGQFVRGQKGTQRLPIRRQKPLANVTPPRLRRLLYVKIQRPSIRLPNGTIRQKRLLYSFSSKDYTHYGL
ncbi:hypothetical protein EVAR_61642_1 [Eumeta japonica]|uniref:Uncharacterized protein n=1 Tax=Eumeta variegata TaxID=151549 RepID=A0A4C1ZAS3_EUMVA|nr:hypothetical protein EVAR_61642_1 [Eumeta japonica]